MRIKTLIVLVGGPCSGKSSAGKIAAERLIAKYISSGDIARGMAKNDNIIKNDLDNGKMAPESKMREAISTHLYEHFYKRDAGLIILDGFPRFGEQAEWLREKLPATIQIKYVLFHAPASVLKNRAMNRGRDDDKSFVQRFSYYREVTHLELYSYFNTIIHTDHIDIEECATALENYIKEVIEC